MWLYDAAKDVTKKTAAQASGYAASTAAQASGLASSGLERASLVAAALDEKASRLMVSMSAYPKDDFLEEPQFEELLAFKAFSASFDLQAQTETIATLLANDPEMAALHEATVPLELTYEIFWLRYFFRYEEYQETKPRAASLSQPSHSVSSAANDAAEAYDRVQEEAVHALEMTAALEASSPNASQELQALENEVDAWKTKAVTCQSVLEALDRQSKQEAEEAVMHISRLEASLATATAAAEALKAASSSETIPFSSSSSLEPQVLSPLLSQLAAFHVTHPHEWSTFQPTNDERWGHEEINVSLVMAPLLTHFLLSLEPRQNQSGLLSEAAETTTTEVTEELALWKRRAMKAKKEVSVSERALVDATESLSSLAASHAAVLTTLVAEHAIKLETQCQAATEVGVVQGQAQAATETATAMQQAYDRGVAETLAASTREVMGMTAVAELSASSCSSFEKLELDSSQEDELMTPSEEVEVGLETDANHGLPQAEVDGGEDHPEDVLMSEEVEVGLETDANHGSPQAEEDWGEDWE